MSKIIRFTKLVSRSYSAAPIGKPAHSLGGDSRNEVIRRALFDAPLREQAALDEEEKERVRVINIAWELYVRERREEHQQRLTAKYQSMVDASNALKELDPALFRASQVKLVNPLFPQQMKVPTFTPGNTIWSYDSNKKILDQKKAAQELKEKKKLIKN